MVVLGIAASLVGSCSLVFSAGSAPNDAGPVDASAPGVADGPSPDADISIWVIEEHEKRIRFSITNPFDEALEFFPVLLIVDEDDLDTQAELSDLRELTLVQGDTPIPIQIETNDTDDGTRKIFWFRTSIAGLATVGYQLYFGAGTSNAGGNVWSSYDAVWHLGPGDVNNKFKDSTQTAREGTYQSGYVGVAGIVGDGASKMSGSIVAKTTDPLAGHEGPCMSASAWVKPVANAGNMDDQCPIDSIREPSEMQRGYQLCHQSGSINGPYAIVSDKFADSYLVPEQSLLRLQTGDWHQIGVSVSEGTDDTLQIYVDGVPRGPSVDVDMEMKLEGDQLYLGYQLEGEIDEIRVSTQCRSDLWMAAEYSSITEPWPVLLPVEARPPDAGP